jgi:branched-chain amino acid transport system permease protein
VVGAMILEPAQLWLAYNFGASRLYLVFYAAVFLLVIILLPRGIVPSVADLVKRWQRGRAVGPAGKAPGAREARAVSGAQPP